VVKNKVAPPFKDAEFDIMYGAGISAEGDILDLAVNNKIVQKSGAWFSYGDQRLGQGRENVRQFLRDNPELLAQFRKEIIEVLDPEWRNVGMPTPEVATSPAVEPAAPAVRAASAGAMGAAAGDLEGRPAGK
jgi:recombination protein RecA